MVYLMQKGNRQIRVYSDEERSRYESMGYEKIREKGTEPPANGAGKPPRQPRSPAANKVPPLNPGDNEKEDEDDGRN